MEITADQIKRTEKQFGDIAKEAVTADFISSNLYVYGSELACLRIEHKMKTGRANYSENLKTWYYTKELQFIK